MLDHASKISKGPLATLDLFEMNWETIATIASGHTPITSINFSFFAVLRSLAVFFSRSLHPVHPLWHRILTLQLTTRFGMIWVCAFLASYPISDSPLFQDDLATPSHETRSDIARYQRNLAVPVFAGYDPDALIVQPDSHDDVKWEWAMAHR